MFSYHRHVARTLIRIRTVLLVISLFISVFIFLGLYFSYLFSTNRFKWKNGENTQNRLCLWVEAREVLTCLVDRESELAATALKRVASATDPTELVCDGAEVFTLVFTVTLFAMLPHKSELSVILIIAWHFS